MTEHTSEQTFMTEQQFKDILTEAGVTPAHAQGIWDSRPAVADEDPNYLTEEKVRDTAKLVVSLGMYLED